jgi:hypothetical protein
MKNAAKLFLALLFLLGGCATATAPSAAAPCTVAQLSFVSDGPIAIAVPMHARSIAPCPSDSALVAAGLTRLP